MICLFFFFFCPPLGFRKIQAVNEAVQEIQVQVDSNQVASRLQGLAVSCRDGLEPLHSYGGITERYPSQNTEFGKSSVLLVIYLSEFPLNCFNRVTQRALHKPSG